MGKPIYILAGQSNANAIAKSLRNVMDEKYGADGYVLVEAYYSGAPLTYRRSKQDWADPGELRKDLLDNTIAALNANPSSQIGGMIWLQGEADTYDIARAGEYESRLGDLFSGFRDDVERLAGDRETGVATAEFVISSLSENAPEAVRRNNWDAIIEGQKAVAATSENVSLINPDAVAKENAIPDEAMFKDGLHYSDAFKVYLAKTLVNSIWTKAGGAEKTEIRGTAGDDQLQGGAGPNLMIGGLGDDMYYLRHPGDVIVELKGEGVDQVFSSTSLTLRYHSQFLEKLTLIGTGDIDGTGNGLNNTIIGNTGDNILDGAWGRDRLFGGGGDDVFRDGYGANRLAGGWGDDTYYIDNPGNRIVEWMGRGTDLVISSIDFSLSDYSRFLENLTLSGAGDINGTGNAKDNVLTGNAGDNVLSGGRGADILIGGKGRDILRGGDGQDIFVFGPGDMNLFRRENHEDMDIILDFEVGEDVIRFENYQASGLSGLKMWADPANDQFVIRVVETGERVVLDGQYSWAEIHAGDNFDFL